MSLILILTRHITPTTLRVVTSLYSAFTYAQYGTLVRASHCLCIDSVLSISIPHFSPTLHNLSSISYSVFFNEDLVSERGAGCEVLVGTSLRMPKIPDYESCRRIIDKVCKDSSVV